MRVAVVSHSSVVASHQEKLCILARSRNVEVHLVVPERWPEANRNVEASDPPCRGVTLHVEKAYLIGHVGAFFFRPGSLRRLMRRLNPDVVHVEEEPWSVACWQAVRAAKAVGAHSTVFTWENVWRRYRWYAEFILRFVLSNAHHLVAGNQEGGEILRRRGFRGGISVIPQYGVDERHFIRMRIDAPQIGPSRAPLIGYIGRVEYSKGVDTLLRSLTMIKARAECVVVGNGSEKENLVALARELHVENKTRFLEGIPHNKVAEYLHSLAVLVLPSRTTEDWKEQFGRILIEAMACEVPVVGSSSGEIPVTIGKGGLVFEEGNASDLATKLDFLLKHRAQSRRFGRAGRRRVLRMYTNKRLASQLLAVFRRVLSEAGT